MKIRLYGDSLALPRHRCVTNQERYITRLNNLSCEYSNESYLVDRSFNGVTINELFSYFRRDNGYFENGDVIILHCGIVDCAPRPIPEFIRNTISKLPHILRKHIIKIIHNNRSKILNFGFQFVKTSPNKFEAVLTNFIDEANKRFKHIFVINICPTDQQTETHSPGLTSNINSYNRIINKVVNQTDSCQLIDICKEVKNYENISEIILKDGHHINKKGHDLIFNALKKKIIKD